MNELENLLKQSTEESFRFVSLFLSFGHHDIILIMNLFRISSNDIIPKLIEQHLIPFLKSLNSNDSGISQMESNQKINLYV
jgi:hypothetical protein